MQSTQNPFTFIKEMRQVRIYNNFLVSFDLSSLLENILLNETIKLVIYYILSNNHDVNISSKNLKELFQFATAEMHYYFGQDIYEKFKE